MNEKLTTYKLLFVEDEESTRKNYISYLKRYYRDVYEAEDGEGALKIYREKQPDIMIVDINLPKLNGLDLVKKIRESDQSTKIIMLTAYADVKYLLQAVELNLVKYLVKPVPREALKEALVLAENGIKEYSVVANKIFQLQEGFFWDYEKEELYENKMLVSLTKTETKVISLLASRVSQVFTYDNIVDYLWNDYSENKINSLKTLVKNLRRKLPDESIKNVFGVGYKIE
ncbi:response regulator [Sulfurimonas aquatica]|uniref:Response regulator n=1 Tax=Sulfurimonas aquatica TaxID=2672570 RepID=A0A975GDI2_9BACT|nr:response regulator transcription factor [Sulfurimonas aquatica]QSZ42710.1 response regulator [Sulfurimonas aquatica]